MHNIQYPSLNSESSVSKSLEFDKLPVRLLGEFFFFEDSSPEELEDTSPTWHKVAYNTYYANFINIFYITIPSSGSELLEFFIFLLFFCPTEPVLSVDFFLGTLLDLFFTKIVYKPKISNLMLNESEIINGKKDYHHCCCRRDRNDYLRRRRLFGLACFVSSADFWI